MIALLGMSLFLHVSGGLQGLWSNAGSALTSANTNVSTSTGADSGGWHDHGSDGGR